MINISSLTPEQAAICDILWRLEHIEQVNDFIRGLPVNTQPIATSLMQVIMIESIDEMAVEYSHCTDAAQYLSKFTNPAV